MSGGSRFECRTFAAPAGLAGPRQCLEFEVKPEGAGSGDEVLPNTSYAERLRTAGGPRGS